MDSRKVFISHLKSARIERESKKQTDFRLFLCIQTGLGETSGIKQLFRMEL